MEHVKLVKLLDLLRKHGVSKYKDQEVELELTTLPKEVGAPDQPNYSNVSPTQGLIPKISDQPTEDEFLFWSAGFDPSEVKTEEPKEK